MQRHVSTLERPREVFIMVVSSLFFTVQIVCLSFLGYGASGKPLVSSRKMPWLGLSPSNSPLEKYQVNAISSGSAICAEVGNKMLKMGGSAVDAAIAAQICDGVDNIHSAGIGGGSFMMVYQKSSGKAYTIDFRERAPSQASKMMFRNASSIIGGLSVAVPGEVAGYYKAWCLFGRLRWRELFKDSIRLCYKGVPVSKALAKAIKQSETKIRNSRGLRKLLVGRRSGALYKEGDILKNHKLGKTLELIADNPLTFYSGSLSSCVVREVQSAGGNMSRKDLRDYKPLVKEALRIKLPNSKYVVLAAPPPSSGALVAFILRILDGYKFKPVTKCSEKDYVLFHQRLVESFKFAYAKRGGLGDPMFEELEVMKNLTSAEFAEEIRRQITDEKTHPLKYYGPAFGTKGDFGTTHLNVIAPNGDVVSWTSSINRYFGSGVRGRSTGIIYNDSMDDFSTPGVSNSFGLAPSAKNFIEPGKRPMSSMSPTIVLDSKGDVALVIGAAGGSKIISSIAYVAARHLFLGETIKEAIDAPRIHHQFLPNVVAVEKAFPTDVIERLKKRGHEFGELSMSVVQGISVDSRGDIYANSDFRKGGKTAGL